MKKYIITLVISITAILSIALLLVPPKTVQASTEVETLDLTSTNSEEITSYLSDITIYENGTIEVIETITVLTDNSTIKQGIYRDYPTHYNKGWLRHEVNFNIEKIEFRNEGSEQPNFVAEKYRVEKIGTGVRIYIGQQGKFLSPGKYTYRLTYTVSDQIRSFKDYQEFYYNITGNEWVFPIDQACTIVRWPVPHDYKETEVSVYTGRVGSKDSNATVEKYEEENLKGNAVKICTNQPLGGYEGLTVSITFPNKANNVRVFSSLKQPTLKETLIDNINLFTISFATIFTIIVSILIVLIFNKDRLHKIIVTQFLPNTDISTSATRFISLFKNDSISLSSTIISLATKGWIRIEENEIKGLTRFFYASKKTYTLYRETSETPLNKDEKLLYLSLFASAKSKSSLTFQFGSRLPNAFLSKIEDNIDFAEAINTDDVELTNSHQLRPYDTHMQTVSSKFYNYVNSNYKKKYSISKKWITSIVVTIFIIIGIIVPFFVKLLQGYNPEFYLQDTVISIFIFGMAFGFSLAPTSQIIKSVSEIKRSQNTFKNIFQILISIVLFTIINVPFIIWGNQIENFPINVPIVLLGNIIVCPVVSTLWYKLIKRTDESEELYRDIRGFERYLTIAEKDRLKFFNQTIPNDYKTFEKYLPYAIALNLETKWTTMFADTIENALAEQGTNNYMSWYTGTSITNFASSFSSFSSSFSSSLSSSISSSSSGSGGGGSSGGGGGGGGGGGW